jgi:hypothetical protein
MTGLNLVSDLDKEKVRAKKKLKTQMMEVDSGNGLALNLPVNRC